MPATLEQDLAERLPEIQEAFAAVLDTFCGADAGIGEICDRLGLHRKLAWQIRGVAQATDPSRTVRMMPSRAGIESLIEAIAGRPGAEPLVERVRLAAASFEQMVSRHAQDRTWLEMLAEATAGDDGAEERWREQAFRGNSFIWGVHVRTLLSVVIINKSATRPGWIDMALVRGLIDLTRVRPNVRWQVSQSVIIDEESGSRPRVRVPLDPEGAAAAGGVPVLRDLCSSPMPRLRRTIAEGADGVVQDELLEAPVGQTGQQTIYTGELIRELGAAHATADNASAYFGGGVRTPARVLIYDHFVHRDLFPGVERELCVFSELHSPMTRSPSDRLPVSERLQRLGPGLTRSRCPDLPGHPKVLASIFQRLGWTPDEFDHFRVRMAYPPLPTSVMIRHDLPRPGPDPAPQTTR
jgi:hypothetical protein